MPRFSDWLLPSLSYYIASCICESCSSRIHWIRVRGWLLTSVDMFNNTHRLWGRSTHLLWKKRTPTGVLCRLCIWNLFIVWYMAYLLFALPHFSHKLLARLLLMLVCIKQHYLFLLVFSCFPMSSISMVGPSHSNKMELSIKEKVMENYWVAQIEWHDLEIHTQMGISLALHT